MALFMYLDISLGVNFSLLQVQTAPPTFENHPREFLGSGTGTMVEI